MKVSYKQLPPNLSKEDFKKLDITRNFKSIETSFDKLSNLLQHNGVMIANMELTNGYRSKSNVILPTTIEFLPLDIDKTTLSIDGMHEILMEYYNLNHILVATSNPDEAYKYRLFLQTTPITINSEEEYKSLFDNIPEFIEFDKNCTDISRGFYIYENSAYTIKEYFKGNPLGIHKKEKSCISSSLLCNRTTAKSEARSSSVKGFLKHKLTTIPNTLKTQKYLCARDKSWYSYEAIRYNPVLLDEANIHKLLKALSNTYPDKIRLNPTDRYKYSVRLNEKEDSGTFYFSDDPDYGTHCIMFKDWGTTENTCDVIDFCAKLVFGNTTKQSRDKICAGLMKKFKISEINPYRNLIS